MESSVFVVDGNNRLTELSRADYVTEDLFQALLGDHPRLLGQVAGASGRLLLIRREAPVPEAEDGGGRWSLDHLFVDADGVPVLVEVKRASDTRARREVVAQMLDDAANGVAYWPVELLVSSFEASKSSPEDAEATLREFLGGGDIEPFWRQVESNLKAGRVRMVFVADRIPEGTPPDCGVPGTSGRDGVRVRAGGLEVTSAPRRVGPAAHLVTEPSRRVQQDPAERRRTAGRSAASAAVHAGHVRPDQHLRVGVPAGADADGRDHQLGGDPLGHVGGTISSTTRTRRPPAAPARPRPGARRRRRGPGSEAAEGALALRVNPRWAMIRGRRSRNSASTCGRIGRAQLDRVRPASFMNRKAVVRACSGPRA